MSLLECSCELRYPTGFRVDATFSTHGLVTALCGPSGSGKTSILSMIAGLRRPSAGRIRLGSQLLFDHVSGIDLPPERRRIGYIFQDYLLFPHLTVRANLAYGWKRRPRDASAVDFDAVVRVLELSDLLDRLPDSLSGGQRQRVALGRGLLCGPNLLLFDEPLSSVEDELKQRLLGYIRSVLATWHIPTLYVTHNTAEARQIADWAVRIEHGRVIGAGRPGDILAEPRIG
jgi:molybdate transport system ATP-binding protein